MRFDSPWFESITIYLRAGTLTVLNSHDIKGMGFSRTTHMDPAAIGQMVHDCASNTLHTNPRLAAPGSWQPGQGTPFHSEDEFTYIAKAAGASSAGNLWRTATRIDVRTDGSEARFMGFQPRKSEGEEVGILGTDALSLHSQKGLPEEFSTGLHPLQIAPWWDPEMIGQAVLLMLSKSGPPFGKGMTSVFDLPSAKTRTALHKAAQEGDIEVLPTGRRKLKGADKADSLGTTPLMLAASKGQTEFAARLVELGASLDPTDNDGRTAPHYAAEEGNHEVVQALVEAGAGVAASDIYGDTPLHLAATRGHAETVRFLLAAGAPVNVGDIVYSSTPLHKAVRGGHTKVVSILVQAGADPNAPNEGGKTPLHLAAAYGTLDIVSLLIKNGADTNRRDRRMETPLHIAAFYQHMECIRLLTESGADVGARDVNGNTPLHTAASMNRDKAARLLVYSGANVEEINDEGMTPVDLAIVNAHRMILSKQYFGERYSLMTEHNAEVAEVLLESGATIKPQRIPVGARHVLWPHLTPSHLLYDNGDINYYRLPDLPEWLRHTMPPEDGPWIGSARPRSATDRVASLLHDAVLKRSSVVVEALLRSGANPTTAVRNRATPLHFAADSGDVELAAVLLDWGADINMPECNTLDGRKEIGSLGFTLEDRGGFQRKHLHTALDVAVSEGKTYMARFLLEHRGFPYVDVPTILRRCPEEVRDEMASMLQEYGALDPGHLQQGG